MRDGTVYWLCRPCFDYENGYRSNLAKVTGHPENWPQASWTFAPVLSPRTEDTRALIYVVLLGGLIVLVTSVISVPPTMEAFFWRFVSAFFLSNIIVPVALRNPWAAGIVILTLILVTFAKYHPEVDIVILSGPIIGTNFTLMGLLILAGVSASFWIAKTYPREWFDPRPWFYPRKWFPKPQGGSGMLKTIVIILIIAYLLFTPNGQMICGIVLIYVLSLFH